MKIFGTDGVRGKAGSDITPFLVLRLGIAAGLYFRKHSVTNKILVGKDTRRSGYMIENALVSALTSVGYDVIQVGPMPTPAVAFLTEDMRCDGGIMISASHNPYEDNGIKFFDRLGFKLDEGAEREIEEIFKNENLIQNSFKTHVEIGSSKRIDDVNGRYIVQIKKSFPKDFTMQGIRVVLDAANGSAYKVAPTIFSELGADVIVIHNQPNGYNINEQCGAIAPNALSEAVKTYRADVGFGLDGDADRLVVVDNEGAIVHGDQLIGALARYQFLTGRLKNQKIVATVMSNFGLEEFLNGMDIKLIRCDVGDKYVSDCMQREDLNFGGEQSGHIIFSDYAKTGDGLVSALQVVAYLKHIGQRASQALHPFELTPQLLCNLPVSQKKPLEEIEGYGEWLQEIEGRHIRHLVRYSGTENKLRILFEGRDKKELDTLMQDFTEFLSKVL
ncbi:phosphoglucosamine mutase [Helicobacter mustelae]|uniref:Phosphoglucosamine mutase n=1 Tax=Helicobacter mustelae (strain ATCC 43772 / CCUG 25715 / CIP 103759 / LMG 18044 / NCTC 12198 / R85-136P) TaxID=679897 RepID=D3UFY1_HELM1|nr:phosphoglucosamine mutase [Helicobacter mustelae]CBG39402.1 putative phospho-sugar mutase [Helicobacter mustelae 12198]SQH70915.1 phospho-sugar mutase [Helicobacter mustelae]STP12042.1 phospho-sugar mutase [Helicobacter mustelae]